MNLKGRSFLTLLDFTEEEIRHLLDVARRLKEKRKKEVGNLLAGKHLVLLFEKTSTRTRCSFEVAMKDEGGDVTFLDKESSQFSKKESIEDSAKVLGRYYHAIEYRGFDQKVVEDLAKYSGVPVYNGLTDVDHPTQILADMMTIEEHVKKPLNQVKIVFVGDIRNNMSHAWMYGAAKMGMHFIGLGPKELFPDAEVLAKVTNLSKISGGSIVITDDVRSIKGADVIYTDVWVSMGEEAEMKKRVELLSKYRVTMDMLRATENPKVKFMHCLPAYHDFETNVAREAKSQGLDVREVTDEVFRSYHSIVFDEAENRMHTIKAVICNAAVGMKSLFDMIHEGPHKLMLFGAACTQVTDPIAKASKHWRLTQLSYADTHPMFTNDNFPNFFRIVPSENAFNPPRLKLLQEFNWTRVGTIYQNEPRFSLAHNRLVADLDILGFHVVETQSFANEVSSALSKLKEKDVRIILGNFNESWAREIFCEAYKFGMYGRKYQWLIMGTYSTEWWLDSSELRNCSVEELNQALEGCILTDLLPLSTNGEITISGNTAEEYRLEYDNLRGSDYSRFHGYTYDGIWTMALAIQHVALRIRHYRKNDTMKDFRYHDELWEQLFLQALKNTSFEGVTGPVRFYDNERKASIMLKQFQGGQEVKIGEFNGVTESLDLSRGHVIRWLGKHPPKDRTLQIFEHNQVNLTVYALLAATASLGIVMTIVFLTINIMYRNQRYIKMSSPYLNNLIIIGCMLTYSSVIFLGLDSQLTSVDAFPYVCTARAWLLMSGFSLAFGSMFSKTWRVHSIFTDVKLNKKVIKDYQLFIVVGVLVGIDLAIMTTWQVADPFYRETKQLEPYPDPTNDDILIIPENEYCQSEKMTIFIGSIYAYKGLLMIFGAFLAWETRHVSIPALNDSKYVGMSVYNVVMMCVMGAAISFVLSDKQDASFIIISVFIIFCTTATLCLVFVPKLVELKRNPQGVIDKKTRATLRPITKSRRDSVASELEDKIKDAKLQHSKYRKQLLDTESELQVLVRRLGSEAAGILDSDSGALDRLSVPLLKREAPSGTETTEISSMCSLNSSQDEEYFGDAKPGQQTPGPRKKTSFAKKTTFEGDNKQEPILRKEQKTRFVDEEDKSKAQQPPSKNVSFGPPEQSKVPTPQEQQLKPKQEVKTKSEQNLEKLGITQIYPKPRQEHAITEQYPTEDKTYEDMQERKIQEVTSHLTSQLLKKHDQQYAQSNARRRSSVKSVNLNENLTCQLEQRRTSVPNWSSNRINLTERKNNSKNAERKKFAEEKRQWAEDRRHSHGKKHGGYIEFAGSDAEANWSDYEGFGSEKDAYSNSSYQNYGYQESQEGLGGASGVVKYIEKDEYWVTQPDILSKRGSISQKGRISPYLLKDNVNNLSSPNVPSSVVDTAQAQDASGMQRSGSERGRRGPCQVGPQALPPSRVRPQTSPSFSAKPPPKHCLEHSKPAKSNFNTNLTHVLSTPDVAAIRPYYDSKTFDIYATEKRGKGHKMKGDIGGSGHLCTAVSEGELLDLAILPIFQKLLTERHKSRTGYGASIASCPNISIKCDIVEYL